MASDQQAVSPNTEAVQHGDHPSSCILTTVSIFFFSLDLGCGSDVSTFALNQACSGKGSLIRHPFKSSHVTFKPSPSSFRWAFIWINYLNECRTEPISVIKVGSWEDIGLVSVQFHTFHSVSIIPRGCVSN